VVGLRDDILKFVNAAITKHDQKASHEALTAIFDQLDSVDPQQGLNETGGEVFIDENDSAIVRLVNQIIVDAWKERVSDVHIEPNGSQQETGIRFRVDGRCFEYLRVPAAYRRALISRLKIMARLDIAERRKPQDGKITFKLPDRHIELRVATIPTAGIANEDIVLRILAAEEPMPLHELRMTPRNLQEFRRLLANPHGLILCAGPTGSGKTTTLHSALGALNTPERKIWTAEDPVEITQRGLRQVQVNPKIGFDFAAAMRAFLRADPDVIMVGEIRDRETAETSIEASLTGHLVLSTLHTNSAVETVTRLLEMGMDPFNFADALLGVLAQRLARTICQQCKERYHPPKEEYDALAYGYGEAEFAKLGISYNERFGLYRGNGCGSCRQTGYKGRIALHELLVVGDEIKKLIHARATVAELLTVAVAQGMTTLIQDGVLKTIEGLTDYTQVTAAAMRM
jgi:type II secretory ATPase GspE/PulE/Tfp pilus assembly ATPase PilB-like protein